MQKTGLTGKKCIAVVLCLIMAFCLLPPLRAEASNQYVINGVTVSIDDFSSSPQECWVFAQNYYHKIWGVWFTNSFSEESNMLRYLSDAELTLTAQHLKTYVSYAPLGSVLRVCNAGNLHGNDSAGHSQVIVSKDSNGFTVLQGGFPDWPYKEETYYTWSGYVNCWLGERYAYIKYIKCPGTPAYQQDYMNSCTAYPAHVTATVGSDGASVWSLPCNSSTYPASGKLGMLAAGTEIEAVALYRNGSGSYWYQIRFNGQKGYVWCGNTQKKALIDGTVSASGGNEVFSTIPEGQAYGVEWLLSAQYSELYKVSGVIHCNGWNDDAVIAEASVDLPARSTSYNLSGGPIDAGLKFGTLSEGNYTTYIQAFVRNYYWDSAAGSVASHEAVKTLKKFNFTVVAEGSDYTDQIPQGVLDSVTGSNETVSVRGWAYDPDEPETSVEIAVYIDGEYAASCPADLERTDVGNAYGCGDYHGFDFSFTCPVTYTGSHTVEVYAVNTNPAGANGQLSGPSGTVSLSPQKHYLDLNGYVNGAYQADISDFGTVDFYVNGILVANDVSDFYMALNNGDQYEVSDIKALEGASYLGVFDGALTGTINGSYVEVVLEFCRWDSVSSGWKEIRGNRYWFDSDGNAATGWKKISGSWYYFDNDGVMQTGWKKVSGKWYYLADDGVMRTGWQKVSGQWYYLAANGAMQTGWQQIGGVWYFLKSSGAMAAKEWCGGYYLNANGSWTYPYKASWKQNAYGWWFGDTSGWYAKDCTITINGKSYTFNASGYWVQ